MTLKQGNVPVPRLQIRTTISGTDYLEVVIGNQACLISLQNSKLVQLNASGVIDASLIPYVQKEVIFVDDFASLPSTGDAAVLYVTRDTSDMYVYDTTSGYHKITANELILGETSTTAYRGDRGKLAYDFSQGISFGTTAALDTIGNGFAYPQSILNINNTRVLFVETFGATNFKGQVAHCEGGIYYNRNQSGTSTWSAWSRASVNKITYGGGEACVITNNSEILIYDINGKLRLSMNDTDTYFLTPYDAKVAIQIERNKVMLGISGTDAFKAEIYSIASGTQIFDESDYTKSIRYGLSQMTTGNTRTWNFPQTVETDPIFASQRWVDDTLDGIFDSILNGCAKIFTVACASDQPLPSVSAVDNTLISEDFVSIQNYLYDATASVGGYILITEGFEGTTIDYPSGIYKILALGESLVSSFILEQTTNEIKNADIIRLFKYPEAAPKTFIRHLGDLDNIYLDIRNPKLVSAIIGDGNGFVHFLGGFEQRYGSAMTWDDIDFPLIVKTTGVGNPTRTLIAGGVYGYTYAVNDGVDLDSSELLHEFAQVNSSALPHVHILTNGVDTSNRYVRYNFEYTAADINGQMNATTVVGAVDLLIPANTPDRTHLIFDIGTFTTKNIGSQTVGRFTRVAATGTAPTANPFVLKCQIHAKKDTNGSRTASTK